MTENKAPPRRPQSLIDVFRALEILNRSSRWRQLQEASAKLLERLAQRRLNLDWLRPNLSPEQRERQKALMTVSSGLVEAARQACEQLDLELAAKAASKPASAPTSESIATPESASEPILSVEQSTERATTQVSERALNKPGAEKPMPSTAVESIERIETEIWWANWIKTHPKHKNESKRAYAQRAFEDMKTAPVTIRWNEEGCRRALYPRPKAVDFAPEPGSVQTYPKRN